MIASRHDLETARQQWVPLIPTTPGEDWPTAVPSRAKSDRLESADDNHRIVLILPQGFASKVVVSIDPASSAGVVDLRPAPVLSKIGPAGRPIVDALDGWVAHLRGKAKRDRSILCFRRRVEECARHAGWLTVADVGLAGAEAWLAARRSGEGGREPWKGTTADHATSILRRFGAYLQRHENLTSNPLGHLEASGEQGGDGSRALTASEVRAMIAAARARAAGDKRQRADAALFLGFLALTGLRYAEAGACRWRDIDLDGTPPAVYTDPAWAKNRRKMRVCLNDEIAGLLRAHRVRTGGAPDERVFASRPNQRTWHLIREAAGVDLRDGRGRVASYHGLRKFFSTALDATGATPGVVSRLTRHAKDLTQKVYIDPDWEKEMAAVGGLPRLYDSGNEIRSSRGLQSAEACVTVGTARHMIATPQIPSATPARPAIIRDVPTIETGGRADAVDRIEHDNGPCQPHLPDFPGLVETRSKVVAAFLASHETLRRLVEGGGL